jgi:hypothetical protein
VLLDATSLILLTVTASEHPINVVENSHIEATQPQLSPTNALIKQYNASFEQGKELEREVHTVIILQKKVPHVAATPTPTQAYSQNDNRLLLEDTRTLEESSCSGIKDSIGVDTQMAN